MTPAPEASAVSLGMYAVIPKPLSIVPDATLGI
jgi:hypothetical protein